MTAPTLRTTLVALLFASFLGLLEVMRAFHARPLVRLHADSLFDLVHLFAVLWGTLVLVSPWCAFMAHHVRFGKGRIARALLLHLGGGAVFVALHMALNLTVHALFTGEPVPLDVALFHLYGVYVAMELSVYAMIVLALLLFEARREADARTVASARLEQGLAQARLESLQAQIRPHFLFNTLNALAVLARKGDGAAVDRAIGDLGELLRASFDRTSRHEIPLGEELAFLERYVDLQRIRFPDRLEVEWGIDDETRRAKVPALVVQPLVENAIEHGLATGRGGRVRVAARREAGALVIEVADDGPGFGGAGDDGTGLANTRERLALLYGAAGTLECGDQPGGGGVVRIRLPWRPAVAPAAVA